MQFFDSLPARLVRRHWLVVFHLKQTSRGEVVRALSGTQQWTEQFAAAVASFGPTFERLVTERPMSDLVSDCEAAAADMDRIGDVLSRAARVVGADNVSLDDTVEWLRRWIRI